MKAAVLTLTRDRLDYTRHCFQTLYELAGHSFDHFVLDQGSEDGTADWLRDDYQPAGLILSDQNIGIGNGLNALLDLAGPYDAYIKFDNDCELVQPGTLAQILDLLTDKLILSPRVEGLISPPPVGEQDGRLGYLIQIGGIFMAVPGWVYREFHYPADLPVWGMDDVQLSHWFRGRGGQVAYVMDLSVNHYETTNGQRARYPAYFARKDREFAA